MYLLFTLCLFNQVGVCSRARDELLDMRDFFLLFIVRLHLVNLVFRLGAHISGIVTTIVHQLIRELMQSSARINKKSHLFLVGEVHDIGAYAVHKVLRVRRNL